MKPGKIREKWIKDERKGKDYNGGEIKIKEMKDLGGVVAC